MKLNARKQNAYTIHKCYHVNLDEGLSGAFYLHYSCLLLIKYEEELFAL